MGKGGAADDVKAGDDELAVPGKVRRRTQRARKRGSGATPRGREAPPIACRVPVAPPPGVLPPHPLPASHPGGGVGGFAPAGRVARGVGG